MKVDKSKAFFERSKRVAPGGVHSPVRGFKGVGGTPRFVESASGAELIDVDGNRYIDFCMSWGPLLFGHQDDEIKESVVRALDRGWSFGTAEPYSLELAEFITSRIPWAQKVRFVNSGTEAVMSALRVARAFTKREKILKFEGCYHGHVDSLLVKAGSGLAEMASPDSAGISEATARETVVVPLDDEDALETAFRRYGHEFAATIIEPLPANNGLLLQRRAFLDKLIERTREHGALLIFDEVISGFRVDFGGMAALLGVQPDLVCYGKVIGGGFPVGAYAGRAEIMDWVAPSGPVYQAGTLSANPVAMSAGLAMLKKLDRERPYAKLREKMDLFASEMQRIAAKHARFRSSLQVEGSLFWPVLGEVSSPDGIVRSVDGIPSVQKEIFAKVFHGMLNRGVYLAPSGFEVGFMSMAHHSAHIDRALAAYDDLLKHWNEGVAVS